MSKNNKSVGRKKWIAGGIIGFASVTLIATGFATWVIGNTDKDDTGDVTVAVDTAKNNSVTLDINLTEKALYLGGADNSEAASNITTSVVTHEGEDEEDLSISLKYTITAGADYYNSLKAEGVQISFKFDSTSASKINVNLTGDANATGKHEPGSLTYLNEPAAIKISKTDFEAQDDGTYICKIDEATTLDFTWGSYFDGKNPITYYNGLFQDGTLSADNAAHLQAVIDELNAMNTAITGDSSDETTLTLTATMSEL